MSRVSSRISSVEPSATVRISNLASELSAEGKDIVDLSAGDPDFPTPDHIRSRAKDSLDEGQTHYTPSNGIVDLREAIASKLRRENNLSVTSDRVTVTPGGKQAIFEALFALLREGDEVVLLNPAWVSYKSIVTMCGGTTEAVRLDSNTGFTLGETDLSDTISNDTRAVIVNTPSNPTGAVLPKEYLQRIRDLAIDHDVWVISDEIYEKLIYDSTHTSIGSLEGMAERTVTINGFSKSHAMTGWRLGYYTAPDPILQQARKVQTHTVTCATSFAQHGACAALNGSQEPVRDMRATYRERRDAAMDKLNTEGIEIPSPNGAFYLFIPVTTDNDVKLCEDLLTEEHVAVTPGTAFGMSGYIRLSYANTKERVLEGIDRISGYLGES